YYFFFSSRRRHTRFSRDWSSDVCSSDLVDDKKVVRIGISDKFVRHTLPVYRLILQFHHGFDMQYIMYKAKTASFAKSTKFAIIRSEERRVGKECRTSGAPRL